MTSALNGSTTARLWLSVTGMRSGASSSGGEISTPRTVPASLALFRISDDGRLDYVRKYDIEVGADSMFWSGIVERAAQ